MHTYIQTDKHACFIHTHIAFPIHLSTEANRFAAVRHFCFLQFGIAVRVPTSHDLCKAERSTHCRLEMRLVRRTEAPLSPGPAGYRLISFQGVGFWAASGNVSYRMEVMYTWPALHASGAPLTARSQHKKAERASNISAYWARGTHAAAIWYFCGPCSRECILIILLLKLKMMA